MIEAQYSGRFWAMILLSIFGEPSLCVYQTVITGRCWIPHDFDMFCHGRGANLQMQRVGPSHIG